MTSFISWVDFSSADRERMRRAIALFQEKETRDELGFGTIRDAFADSMFPGTSTIQTRLRYFLFVPWIYRELAESRTSSDAIGARARKRELALIEPLRTAELGDGVIGARSKDQSRQAAADDEGSVGVQGSHPVAAPARPGPRGSRSPRIVSIGARGQRLLARVEVRRDLVDDQGRRCAAVLTAARAGPRTANSPVAVLVRRRSIHSTAKELASSQASRTALEACAIAGAS